MSSIAQKVGSCQAPRLSVLSGIVVCVLRVTHPRQPPARRGARPQGGQGSTQRGPERAGTGPQEAAGERRAQARRDPRAEKAPGTAAGFRPATRPTHRTQSGADAAPRREEAPRPPNGGGPAAGGRGPEPAQTEQKISFVKSHPCAAR